MDPVVIGSLISAGSSLLGGVMGQQQGAQDREWQEKMWHMQNDYNKPSAQKQRLIDAKLNPSLMYQTAPQNVSEQVQSPNYFNPMGEAIGKAGENMGQLLLQAHNASVQNDNIRADTAMKLQEVKFRESNNPQRLESGKLENEGKTLENQLRQIEKTHKDEYMRLQNKGLRLNTEKLGKEISFMDTNQKLHVKEILAKIRQMDSSTNLNHKQAIKTAVETELQEMEREYRKQGISFNDAMPFRELKATIHNMAEQAVSGSKYAKGNTLIGTISNAIQQVIENSLGF